MGECEDLGAEEGGFEIDYCWGIGRHFVWVVDFESEMGRWEVDVGIDDGLEEGRRRDDWELGDALEQHVTCDYSSNCRLR